VLLSSEERYVIVSLFGLNDSVIRSIRAISVDLNMTSQDIKVIKAEAMRKLKSDKKCLYLLSKYLEDFN